MYSSAFTTVGGLILFCAFGAGPAEAAPLLSSLNLPSAVITQGPFTLDDPEVTPCVTKQESARNHAQSTAKPVTEFNETPFDALLAKTKAQSFKFPSSQLCTDRTEVQGQSQPPTDGTAELSKKLSNPVSSLISLPVQSNFDFGMGQGSGWRFTMNIQPVIPVALNKDWNLISRTIVPIIHQGNVIAPGTSQNGLGDTVQSIFFSPNKTEPFIWGIGPVVLVPTATNDSLGSKQLGFGPTAVVLNQQGPWTTGVLWNHIWRVAGGSGRQRVNSDFVQPFLSYATRDGWTYTLNTESVYDWTGNHWAIPIHGQISKIVRFGKQPVSFGGGIRCWATSPQGGPQGCGLRIVVTGIFPKRPKN